MDNIEEIAYNIFTNPPKDVCSIELYLEDTKGAQDTEGTKNIDIVFNVLCELTLKGVKILFGEKSIVNLDIDEFMLLQKYVRSYGYEMIVTANDTDKSPWYFTKNNVNVYRFKIVFQKYCF
jgi:hypothetical protein